MPEQRYYRAYLLRIWAEPGLPVDQPLVWRYSLQDPHTGGRRGFATLEALIAFVQSTLAGAQIEVASGASED